MSLIINAVDSDGTEYLILDIDWSDLNELGLNLGLTSGEQTVINCSPEQVLDRALCLLDSDPMTNRHLNSVIDCLKDNDIVSFNVEHSYGLPSSDYLNCKIQFSLNGTLAPEIICTPELTKQVDTMLAEEVDGDFDVVGVFLEPFKTSNAELLPWLIKDRHGALSLIFWDAGIAHHAEDLSVY